MEQFFGIQKNTAREIQRENIRKDAGFDTVFSFGELLPNFGTGKSQFLMTTQGYGRDSVNGIISADGKREALQTANEIMDDFDDDEDGILTNLRLYKIV